MIWPPNLAGLGRGALSRSRAPRGAAIRAAGLALVPAVTLLAACPAGADGSAHVSGLASPAVRELITVTAASHAATYATLRAYRVSGGKRVLVFGPWTARVGYNGIAPPGRKREGDGRTPSGTFGFSFFFGVRPDPGFAFGFRHAFRYDVWDDDPASPRYNEWVDVRVHNPGSRPEPLHQVPAYDYAAVIAYNTARVPGRGSAIFLHVGTGSATAGCVSLPAPRLLAILHWLRPPDLPLISITAR
jgi:L,D-peptidoglycan transpeptidase YkuD (ErfK/YbiS/YcfS/YnhG family)